MERVQIFPDRRAAGRVLARALERARLSPPVIVLGLPRGGVPVAFEVARALHAPLDVMVVRKVGMPGQPELAIGAIASGGIVVREPLAGSYLAGRDAEFEHLAGIERVELERRERAFRGGRAPLNLKGHTVVLVDDGLATGATMLAAVRAARQLGAASVVVAAPIASGEAQALVSTEADHLIVLETPTYLMAIGQWYEDFTQVEDSEVRALLEQTRHTAPRTTPAHE